MPLAPNWLLLISTFDTYIYNERYPKSIPQHFITCMIYLHTPPYAVTFGITFAKIYIKTKLNFRTSDAYHSDNNELCKAFMATTLWNFSVRGVEVR